MKRDEQIWNQYAGLKDEIITAGESNNQVLGIVAGFVSVILAAGVSQTDVNVRFYIFLCTYIVTYTGYRLLVGNRRRTWRISTYIQVFLESELEYVKWESRLSHLRKFSTREKSTIQTFSSLVNQNEARIIIGLNGIIAIASIATVFLAQSNVIFKTSVISVLLLINLGWGFSILNEEKKLRRFGEFEQQALRSWEQMALIELFMVNFDEDKNSWINVQVVRKDLNGLKNRPITYINDRLNELVELEILETRRVKDIEQWRFRDGYEI